MFFPGGTQPSWKITEIPGVEVVGQAPAGMEILGGGGGGNTF